MASNKRLIAAGAAAGGAGAFDPLQNFETVTYTGNGSTQKITGYIRKGAAFNGSSSKILIGEFAGLNTSDYSVSLWFNHDSSDTSTNNRRLIQLNCSSAGDAGLFDMMFKQSTFEFTIRSGSTGTTILSYTSNATELPDDTWNHIAVTRDNTTNLTTLYINGTNVKEQTQAEGSTFGAFSSIGCRASGDLQVLGKIDQVRIFNTELNSTQVGALEDEEYGDSTVSTTDFGGYGGIALYQLDEDADDTGGVSGKFDGSSAHFNGTDSSVGNNSIDTATTKAVSIWVNAADFSERWPFQQGDGQGVENFIRFYNTDDIQVRWGNVTQTFSGYSADTWYHIVAQTDASGNANVWINGTEVGTSTAPSTLTVDSTNIGRRKNGATWQYYFKGLIDDVRIYSDTLTDAEIGYLYNNTTASIPTNNLTAYYKFNGNATDETTNHDGTESNVTYGYNGTATNVNFLGMAFQPDAIWIKSRDNSRNHRINDSLRVGEIYPNLTNKESSFVGISSYDSNGFTIGTSDPNYNANGEDYVAWCWKAGGVPTPNNNTQGTITSTVSANPDAGFSIVKYTKSGTSGTMGHGLSSAPELIMEKRTDSAAYWNVRVNGITANNQTIYLNESTGVSTHPSLNLWTTPTTSVFGYDSANATAGDYIAYCFHSVDGYQKVGSYTGTGVSGNSETTGFRPRFLMVKAAIRPSGGGSWYIFDSVRTTSNPQGQYLQANEPLQEFDGTSVFNIDFENNGFTVNGTNNEVNQSGSTYIYLAIA